MRRLTTFLAIAMMFVLIAAACGGDDETATTTVATSVPPAAPAPTTAPITPDPVAIASTVNVELSEFSISLDTTVGDA